VVSVRTFEGLPVGLGLPGAVGCALNAMLERDVESNPALRTLY